MYIYERIIIAVNAHNRFDFTNLLGQAAPAHVTTVVVNLRQALSHGDVLQSPGMSVCTLHESISSRVSPNNLPSSIGNKGRRGKHHAKLNLKISDNNKWRSSPSLERHSIIQNWLAQPKILRPTEVATTAWAAIPKKRPCSTTPGCRCRTSASSVGLSIPL